MSKVFEKISVSYLNKYIKPRAEQHYFRHGYSTTTKLIKLIYDMVIIPTITDTWLKYSWTWRKRSIECGTKDQQFSCLFPLLYIQYINEIPSSPHVTTSLFADDTMFYSSNTSKNFAITRLQRQVTTSTDWIQKWLLKLNTQKTVCILFGTSQKPPARKIQIIGQTINWKNKTTYLGVTLDKVLRLNEHVKVCIRKAKQARGAL